MIKVPLLRHQRHISPSPLTLPLQNQRQNQGKSPISILTPLMDMLWSIIYYIEPNLQEIIFGPIRAGLITALIPLLRVSGPSEGRYKGVVASL